MPRGVVQVAGDAHALLGGGEPALALGLALGVPSALLELGDPLAPQPRPVAGEPGRRPHAGAEEDLGREALPHEVGHQEDDCAHDEKGPPQAVLGPRRARRPRCRARRRTRPAARARSRSSYRAAVAAVTTAKTGSGANRRATSGSAVSATSTTATASRAWPSSSKLPRAIAASENARTATAMRASSRNRLLRRAFTALEGSEGGRTESPPGRIRVLPGGGRRSSSLGALWRRVAPPYRGGMTENTHLVVETQDLGKRYGERIVAVDGLNLEVRRGEVYGFLGPNGAGKTTTLRMLLGLIRPTTGHRARPRRTPGNPRRARPPRRADRDADLLPVPVRPRQPARPRPLRRGARDAHRHGPRGGRPDRPGRRPLPDLLARDEAAPRNRRGAAQGP